MGNGLSNNELKEFLDSKYVQYNQRKFIESDPIQVPHTFTSKEDIEISSFLTATIAWGQRKTIIKNSFKMMDLLDNSPHDYIINSTEKEINKLTIKHRTFNEIDFRYFIKRLKDIYNDYGNLENIFLQYSIISLGKHIKIISIDIKLHFISSGNNVYSISSII